MASIYKIYAPVFRIEKYTPDADLNLSTLFAVQNSNTIIPYDYAC